MSRVACTCEFITKGLIQQAPNIQHIGPKGYFWWSYGNYARGATLLLTQKPKVAFVIEDPQFPPTLFLKIPWPPGAELRKRDGSGKSCPANFTTLTVFCIQSHAVLVYSVNTFRRSLSNVQQWSVDQWSDCLFQAFLICLFSVQAGFSHVKKKSPGCSLPFLILILQLTLNSMEGVAMAILILVRMLLLP